MLVRLDRKIWEIGEGGTKRGLGSGVDEWGLLGLGALVCVGCISVAAV
jgi:hypothetical protein